MRILLRPISALLGGILPMARQVDIHDMVNACTPGCCASSVTPFEITLAGGMLHEVPSRICRQENAVTWVLATFEKRTVRIILHCDFKLLP